MFYNNGFGMGFMGAGFGFGFVLMLIWAIYWKGMALWRAARLGHKEWFVAILLINTAGLLEIAYLYYFTSPEEKAVKEVKEKKEE